MEPIVIMAMTFIIETNCRYDSWIKKEYCSRNYVSYFNDQEHGASCWVYYPVNHGGSGISCLPNSQLKE